MNDIKDDPIYKDEYLRHQARLDLENERARATNDKKKKEQDKNFYKYMIVGIVLIITLYFIAYKPLLNMFNAI